MKEYRGLIRIECVKEKCVKKRKQIIPSCIDCEFSVCRVVDLEEKTIFVLTKKVQKSKPIIKEN